MIVLAVNLGSTSFKCKLYVSKTAKCHRWLASASVENIGSEHSVTMVETKSGKEYGTARCATYAEALQWCQTEFSTKDILKSLGYLDAIGFKAVHGGSISGARLVDDEVIAEMQRMQALAPAHNPMYLQAMQALKQIYPEIPQIACFETAFHATIPMKRAVYGIPEAWTSNGIRRYGFHGSSHSYIAERVAQLNPKAKRIISCHLGGSSSICAILDGESVACSMGATPQSGLFHNNRVGDLDVFVLPAVLRETGTLEQALQVLSSQSGFLGISGVSNDMRDVETAAAQGNTQAQLALDAFTDEIIGYIGMYVAYLGGLDMLVFTGGIGQNAPGLRRNVCDALEYLGVSLDERCNTQSDSDKISAPQSKVEVYVLPTNEELMIVRNVWKVLKAQQDKQ